MLTRSSKEDKKVELIFHMVNMLPSLSGTDLQYLIMCAEEEIDYRKDSK